jgi:hypothetical protein
MNDWQAGYNGLMHPPGHNRNFFNAGIAARQHDQSMADMAARHDASMRAIRSQSNSYASSGGGGAGWNLSDGDGNVIGRVLGGIVAFVFLAWVVGGAPGRNHRSTAVSAPAAEVAPWPERIEPSAAPVRAAEPLPGDAAGAAAPEPQPAEGSDKPAAQEDVAERAPASTPPAAAAVGKDEVDPEVWGESEDVGDALQDAEGDLEQ